MNEVVVVGGGIVGSSAAYRLASEQIRVTLIDREHQGLATAAGAGIISAGLGVTRTDHYNQLSAGAAHFYPQLVEQLAQDGETDTGYQTVGSIFVATSADEADRLLEIMHFAEERRAAGIPGVDSVSMIGPTEARSLFPSLRTINAGVHISGTARIDGRLMRGALHRAAEKRGVRIVHGEARLSIQGGEVTGVEVDGERIPADAVIVAAGAWSSSLLGDAEESVPVYPQRGQIAHLLIPDTDTSHWPVISTFHGHYILTFPQNRVVVGATREDDSGYDYRLTAGGVFEVLERALFVAPGLKTATLHEVRIGLRPVSPDQLPILGQIPGYTNLYAATGHGPTGLTVGPYSGALVADLVLGRPVEPQLAPFSPNRFAGITP